MVVLHSPPPSHTGPTTAVAFNFPKSTFQPCDIVQRPFRRTNRSTRKKQEWQVHSIVRATQRWQTFEGGFFFVLERLKSFCFGEQTALLLLWRPKDTLGQLMSYCKKKLSLSFQSQRCIATSHALKQNQNRHSVFAHQNAQSSGIFSFFLRVFAAGETQDHGIGTKTSQAWVLDVYLLRVKAKANPSVCHYIKMTAWLPNTPSNSLNFHRGHFRFTVARTFARPTLPKYSPQELDQKLLPVVVD